MRPESIREHLRPYSIRERRTTTINHAFASAIAPVDQYDPRQVSEAIADLGQDPNRDLVCVYCGSGAETWDHLFALVKGGEYSGYGHTLGNLVPCCKQCNSQKGNKPWHLFLESKVNDKAEFRRKSAIIDTYAKKHQTGVSYKDIQSICASEILELIELKEAILTSMRKADEIAENIRQRVRATRGSRPIFST
jgi:hypothetical protein